jgi:2-phospho-L-lactate/phosphoenolpyruvate guanylyltransferase
LAISVVYPPLRCRAGGKIGAVPSTAPWTLLIPVKEFRIAKSRLTGVSSSVRQELALAFACDVVAAGMGCSEVDEVVVVTNDAIAATRVRELGARVLPDVPDAGLNPALEFAAVSVLSRAPGAGLAVMSADLPAARPVDLEAALTAAPPTRWFVSDLSGRGTTMLGAPPGHDLSPDFGPGSGDAHRASGAMEVAGPDLLRLQLDVDTSADLRAAAELGVGAATTETLTRVGWSEQLRR